MPHQIANQSSIIRHLARPFTVTNTGRLHDRLIVSHRIDETDESVVQHRKLFPSQGISLSGGCGH